MSLGRKISIAMKLMEYVEENAVDGWKDLVEEFTVESLVLSWVSFDFNPDDLNDAIDQEARVLDHIIKEQNG